ncbi:S8 family serine peptidase [Priestia megaterium]|uniref:S8 family serine peptidase n=1 Tax=Priestia megaterium TaxID=1404 RepID=UPI002E1B5FA7|nr:S8 family serine peptidase [Priestia megaterium]MED4286454.1 S8 family serine peptidase [Priestia megaterium]
MTQNQEVYTYRAGQKVKLKKKMDQFVVRALPDELEKKVGITDAKQVSPSSSRVTTRTTDLESLMNRAKGIAPTHHAYYVADTDKEFLITDRVFVTFRKPLPPEEVGSFAGKYGLFMLDSYGDRDYLFQLTDHTGMNPIKLVVKLIEQEPLVETAEHDLNYRMNKYQLGNPTDPSYLKQWHLHMRFHNQQFDPRSSARCEEAWEAIGNYGSPEIVVGLTDDGCKLNHTDFNSSEKFAGWGYFTGARLITNVDIDKNSDKMYEEGHNHGTSCAGVIGAEVDAQLTVGAAPGCRLLPIKWESKGPSLFISDSKMLTVLNYVEDKVDVLSNSWGGVPINNWIPRVISRITELSRTGGRRGKGIVFLWAAGNENCPIHHNASQEVPYTNGWKLRVWVGVETAQQFENNLVGIPGVMHIAALASTAKRSHYSNYGTGISICAPTNNVHEYGRLPVEGLGITTTTGSIETVTNSFGGTSSATPLTAGIVALTISANPDLTSIEVISILKRTASKDLNFEGYPRTPPANFDTDTSWDVSPIAPFNRGEFKDIGDPDGTWSPWFGHGRVDALNAVEEALRLKQR